MSKKKIKVGQCVYCGETKRTTRDHVVSKNLFPDGFPKINLITVPCCLDCNNGFSLDEEYFRIFVTNITAENSKHAAQLFGSKIKKSIILSPKLGHKILSNMELIDAYTKSGIYLGRKTKIHIPDEDWVRYHRVLGKFIKGLFFKEFGERLPDGYQIRHYFGQEESRDQLKIPNKWNTDNSEVFFYGYNSVPGLCQSIWATVFFNWLFFISYVATDEDFAEFAQAKVASSED